MTIVIDIQPLNDELPSNYADRLGVYYSKKASTSHKKENGQFFTPTSIAKLMGSLCNVSQTSIKILDPGCGTAILSCALIEHLVGINKNINEVDLVLYEIDQAIMPITNSVLDYLTKWLLSQNIKFKYNLNTTDFVLENAAALNNRKGLSLFKTDEGSILTFDVIISNPPYFKLSKTDKRSLAAKELVSGQPNIYSLFMGIASKLLNVGGELIFITPRSFASGNYFKTFRSFFFNTVQIEKIHLFNSRKDTFSRDSVLQETVIIKAVNETINPDKNVIVSSSSGVNDILTPTIKYFNSSELINIESNEKILHLPINDNEEAILNLVTSWVNVLSDFDIRVSTGPVVAFRAKEYIQNHYENSTVFLAPLFWLHNIDKMKMEWPRQLKEKGQYIRIESGSKSLLLPNKNYILLRRFSTKDDKSRLIAAPYLSDYEKSDFIGVENKVNYIYRKNGQLQSNELIGLCALLNSEVFNIYFQIFNGNVNVSATELREMRLPPINFIMEIGDKVILSNDHSMKNIDNIVNETIGFSQTLNIGTVRE